MSAYSSPDSLFAIGGISHAAALVALAAAGAVMIAWGRRAARSQADVRTVVAASQYLALACLAGIAISLAFSFLQHPGQTWQEALPLHFCDVMAGVCAYVLLTRSATATAIAFFCVMCASAQALITPNLRDDFPALTYFSFFLSHGVTVIAALYFVIALRWRPKRLDFLKAQAFGIGYLILIHPVNLLLETNFGFTRYIPESGSVLSLLGPWPWYMFTMQIPAFIFMGLLNYILYKTSRNFRCNPAQS